MENITHRFVSKHVSVYFPTKRRSFSCASGLAMWPGSLWGIPSLSPHRRILWVICVDQGRSNPERCVGHLAALPSLASANSLAGPTVDLAMITAAVLWALGERQLEESTKADQNQKALWYWSSRNGFMCIFHWMKRGWWYHRDQSYQPQHW